MGTDERTKHASAYGDATTVHARGDGTFDAEIHPGWDIGGHANGGYLLGIIGRAMAHATGRPPISLTAHYLAPGLDGRCSIEVEVVREGRRMATATAVLRQGDRQIVRALGTFGELLDPEHGADGPVLVDGAPPDLPAFDDCVVAPDPPAGDRPGAGMGKRLASRLRPGDEGFRTGDKTGRAEMSGWFEFADGAPVDAIGLLFVADAFAPPIFNFDYPVGWVPTLELTVHIRGVPAAGPLRCVFRSRFVQGDLVEEDGEIWDSAGALVAQSRQISLTPRGS